jgi:hypothetical protein
VYEHKWCPKSLKGKLGFLAENFFLAEQFLEAEFIHVVNVSHPQICGKKGRYDEK